MTTHLAALSAGDVNTSTLRAACGRRVANVDATTLPSAVSCVSCLVVYRAATALLSTHERDQIRRLANARAISELRRRHADEFRSLSAAALSELSELALSNKRSGKPLLPPLQRQRTRGG